MIDTYQYMTRKMGAKWGEPGHFADERHDGRYVPPGPRRKKRVNVPGHWKPRDRSEQ